MRAAVGYSDSNCQRMKSRLASVNGATEFRFVVGGSKVAISWWSGFWTRQGMGCFVFWSIFIFLLRIHDALMMVR